MSRRRIGILTGGGDAPGLNAVIRAVAKYGAGSLGWEIIGVEDSFNGLLSDPRRLPLLEPRNLGGLLHRGGTILGTTNRGDPFNFPVGRGRNAPRADRSEELAAAVREEGLEGLIVVGGDGTQDIAWRLMRDRGVPVIGVPKTIDNDLESTDLTFGFWSAVQVATDALDRLHTTAEAHDRIMLLEVMGREAGWIALYAGVAGGADCIALPEIPYDPDLFCKKVLERKRQGRQFTLIVVAEGAAPCDQAATGGHGMPGPLYGGGASATLARLLGARLDAEIRVTVLGHLQRGGSPVAFDRVLATQMGVHAVDLAAADRWGELVCMKGTSLSSVPLREAVGRPRLVSVDHPLIRAAQAVGTEFGG